MNNINTATTAETTENEAAPTASSFITDPAFFPETDPHPQPPTDSARPYSTPSAAPQSTFPHPDSRFLTDSNAFNGFFLSVISQTPSNSAFSKLTPDDHATLLHWLLHHNQTQVRDLLAKPRPEGLAIDTSIMSISRYRSKHLSDYLCALHEHDAQVASGLAASVQPKSIDAMDAATLAALRRRLFNTALRDDSEPLKIRALCYSLKSIGDRITNTKKASVPEVDPATLAIDIKRFFGI